MSATHIAIPSSGATPQAACIMSHFSAWVLRRSIGSSKSNMAALRGWMSACHAGPRGPCAITGLPPRARTRKAARLVKLRRFAYLAAMAIRSILTLPDPRLRKAAAPVEAIDADLRALAADMLETMYDAPGIGLRRRSSGQ